jgi:hypothetical protein
LPVDRQGRARREADLIAELEGSGRAALEYDDV